MLSDAYLAAADVAGLANGAACAEMLGTVTANNPATARRPRIFFISYPLFMAGRAFPTT
jgi:hypothetical protein